MLWNKRTWPVRNAGCNRRVCMTWCACGEMNISIVLTVIIYSSGTIWSSTVYTLYNARCLYHELEVKEGVQTFAGG